MCRGYFDVSSKPQCGDLPRCCAVEEIGLLLFIYFIFYFILLLLPVVLGGVEGGGERWSLQNCVGVLE